jgi:signal transduction histidine kinase
VWSRATAHRLSEARRRPATLVDVAVAAAVLGGSLLLLERGGLPGTEEGRTELDALGVALAACAALALVAWRRSALAAFAAAALFDALLAALGYAVGLPLAAAAALYLLAAGRDERHGWTALTTAIVVGAFLAYLAGAAVGTDGFPASDLFHGALAFAVAWFAGERTRLRRVQIAEERRLAVAEERARIARDLHDSAGHAINVIAVRAGAARLRHHQDPDRSLVALETIEAVARQTAGEIDQIVAALRSDRPADGRVDAPPGLASLATLVADHTAAGLAVQVDTEGTPRALTSAVDQAAFRIAQEALTNAARHGAGSARIAVSFTDAELELTVTNPVLDAGPPRPSGGHGLVGMQERATLAGGRLDAGRVNGSFSVRARLPYAGSPG